MPHTHFRAHQRFPLHLGVTVSSLSRDVSGLGHLVDIGLGGAACEIDTPLRLGEQVQVVIRTQGMTVVQGEIAWVGWAEHTAVRLGLRFAPSETETIASLLEAEIGTREVGT